MRSFGEILSRWRSKAEPTGAAQPLPRPNPPVCVIGDLHGRLDLLERMLATIAARAGGNAHRVIVAGDMIDRGPQSAEVLHRLAALNRAAPDQVICLMGNHERMMLDFLADAMRNGPLWLANGGDQTLASFGLSPWAPGNGTGPTQRLERLAADLATAMTGDLAQWLAALPMHWHEGGLAVAHAGANPDSGIDDQTADSLLWGHPAFPQRRRRDGIWVVHGHTIVPAASAQDGRIAVDTGAWRTGRLSAAWLGEDGLQLIEVTDRQG